MPQLVFRGRRVARERALIMGIINRTPDSFYDHGANWDPRTALDSVARMIDAGADVIDIGGVKAGVGPEVTVAEEIDRVVPFIETVRSRFSEAVISADTWRADVGRAAAEAGADLINDTWAGADPDLAYVAAEFNCGYVCSHTGGVVPRTDPTPDGVKYDDVVADVITTTTAKAESLVALGVPRDGILIDPTHDFGKTTAQGLKLLRRTSELVATGWPVLMALSRKDFVGETLDLPVEERLEGTLAATSIAAMAGATMFRVHDIEATRRVLDMVASIRGDRLPAAPVRGLELRELRDLKNSDSQDVSL